MHFPKESIFSSTIRTLFRAAGAVLGVFIAGIIVLFIASALTQPEILPQKNEITIAADADGNRRLLPSTSPIVLRINIEGIIGLDALQIQEFRNLLYTTQESPIAGRIRAILLYVNTPGGTVLDSSEIYKELLEYKKKYNIPVYAFVEGLCASGGMYICSAADKIYATSSSLIGSVGVIGGTNFNVSGLMETLKIQSLTLTEGKGKDALNPFRPWKPDEDANYAAIIKETYDQFLDVVTSGRPNLSRAKLIHEYGANVFLAQTAAKFGYIDVADATYSQALRDLTSASNLVDVEYQVLELHKPASLLTQLTQNKLALLSGKIEHSLYMGPFMHPKLSGQLLYLHQP